MRGIGKGMATLFGRMMRPAVTELYPAVKRQLPERSRMSFAMACDEDGLPHCKACMLCERSCPDNAIIIESEKRSDGPGRVLTKFTMDLGRCMYCGMCVEQCAFDGLHHTGDFEINTTERSGAFLVLYEASPGPAEQAPAIDEPTPDELTEVSETFGAVHADEGEGS
jgi:NADH-quinone oxidoreductase subunit I